LWKAAVSLLDQIRGKSPGFASGTETLDKARSKELGKLCDRIDYRFTDLSILDQALIHSSYSYEYEASDPEKTIPNYESMEFLGDSILGFVISEFLFLSYPDKREGFLSKIKSQLVSTEQLSVLSEKLGTGEFLKLGRGEEKTGGKNKKAILADLFESLLAAVYLDGGFKEARSFVLRQFKPCFEDLEQGEFQLLNSKSALQERLHEMGLEEPEYKVIAEKGPQHNKKFVVEVRTRSYTLSEGSGSSKKNAEQDAAKKALESIKDQAQFLK
jgi:ribonuclease III